MKRILFLLLAFMASVSTCFASVKIGELCYNLNASTRTAEVVYENRWTNNYTNLTSVVIPDSVSYQNVTYVVTSIGFEAFSWCPNLTAVTIPNTVTKIGISAFYDSGLTSVDIPNSVTSIGDAAFSSCRRMISVTIPNSVTFIDQGAFSYCTSLTSVTLPNSITQIGESTFGECSNLRTVILPDSLISIGRSAFVRCSLLTDVDIPETVKIIGDGAFSYCPNLVSVVIPDGVTKIDYFLFTGCSRLRDVVMSKNVTSIGYGAFSGCNSLRSIEIPRGVTAIGAHAFENCSSLSSVMIPNTVASVGYQAFYGCTGLRQVTSVSKTPPALTSEDIFSHVDTLFVPVSSVLAYQYSDWSPYFTNVVGKTVQITYLDEDSTLLGEQSASIGSSADSLVIPPDRYGYSFGWDQDVSCVTSDMTVKVVYWRDAVDGLYYLYDTVAATATLDREVEAYSSLRMLSVPAAVNYRNTRFAVDAVADSAFLDCRNLTRLYVAYSVESIGRYAFAGCSAMDTIILGAGLNRIEDYAFQGCSRIDEITVYATRVVDLTEYGFDNIGDKSEVKVYVPAGCLSNYQQDSCWAEFDLRVKNAENVPADELTDNTVVVEADDDNVIITWPAEEDADAYVLTIHQDDELFCTLQFDAQGRLDDIAYVIGRDGQNQARYATQTGNGFRYKVTSLDRAAAYVYYLNVLDTNQQIIKSYTGGFVTDGYADEVYVLTLAVNDSAGGYVTGSGKYAANSEVTVHATPAEGYRFLNWSDGSTENPYTFTIVEDLALTAAFKDMATDTFTITVLSEDETMGRTMGGGEYQRNEIITIRAEAYDGYRFVMWDDGNVENPRSVTVTEDAEYIASFEAVEDALETVNGEKNAATKVMVNGVLYLRKQGQLYNALGQQME